MTKPDVSAGELPDAGTGLASSLVLAIAAGLAMAVATGALEWLPVMLFAPNRELCGELPWQLGAAVLGERIITHALWLCFLLTLIAVSRHALTRPPRASPLPGV